MNPKKNLKKVKPFRREKRKTARSVNQFPMFALHSSWPSIAQRRRPTRPPSRWSFYSKGKILWRQWRDSNQRLYYDSIHFTSALNHSANFTFLLWHHVTSRSARGPSTLSRRLSRVAAWQSAKPSSPSQQNQSRDTFKDRALASVVQMVARRSLNLKDVSSRLT